MARVRLNDSVLATVAWNATKAGLFGGVCADVRDWRVSDDGQWIDGRISRVALGGPEDVCLAGARVIDTLEGDDA